MRLSLTPSLTPSLTHSSTLSPHLPISLSPHLPGYNKFFVNHKTYMGRNRSKSDLPSKMCPVCQRPFTWRKKWADCWDDVKYCSERCRRRRSEANKNIDC
ncbi:hypothetical protein NIES267_67330 [Calothrix parasitica NIES-267]|uniref:DUF2256 domain-containing protein n=1 Tax=Calothrix parasitica NIES-267 TaxID=1973488 RepID=A0A1Z4M132_9CYAN|nr:hypothetical protein NIES267_67330 [Calothrix parasitica NIES-267]